MWKGSALKRPMRIEKQYRGIVLIKGCCKTMNATSLRYPSVLVSAGWPGEISVCVGYTCVHFQMVFWDIIKGL